MEMDAIAPKQAPELERRRLAEGVADMHAVGRELVGSFFLWSRCSLEG